MSFLSNKQVKAELSKALEMLRQMLQGTSWTVHKKGAFGIVAYNTVTKQRTPVVYCYDADSYVCNVLAEIRVIENNNE